MLKLLSLSVALSLAAVDQHKAQGRWFGVIHAGEVNHLFGPYDTEADCKRAMGPTVSCTEDPLGVNQQGEPI